MKTNNFEANQLIEISKSCLQVLDEKKGEDLLAMDLTEVNNFLDYFIVATGNSVTHCSSLAKNVSDFLLSKGLTQRSKSNYDSEWIIVDFSEIVVHIFTIESRKFYQLEKLWGDAKILN